MKLWSPALPPRPACPHRRLRRILVGALPEGITVDTSSLHPWASANFVGARHIFTCTVASGANDAQRQALDAQLGARDWALPGQIVADVAVDDDRDDRLRIEILTVED